MLSPYEELEYLADYLPEEGETVLVTRRGGELICEPAPCGDLREGVEDVELYGRLVQANERLNGQGAFPLWMTAIGFMLACIGMFQLIGLGWSEWFVAPALGMLSLFGCFHWIRHRQHRLFEQELLPTLKAEAQARRISAYALMAGVRQHVEFRTLLDELVRWQPETAKRRVEQ